jgi:uncharacterized RDD family membrane protein YckC
MPTGYDLLEHSHEFRMHIMRRVAAGLIDVLVIFLPVVLFIYLFDLEPKEILAGVFSGFIWFIYSTLIELRTGATLGKKVLGLIVTSTGEPMTLSKEIVRNVPKMFWYVLLPVDIFVGLAVNEDPRQRWTDNIVGAVVIKNEKRK